MSADPVTSNLPGAPQTPAARDGAKSAGADGAGFLALLGGALEADGPGGPAPTPAPGDAHAPLSAAPLSGAPLNGAPAGALALQLIPAQNGAGASAAALVGDLGQSLTGAATSNGAMVGADTTLEAHTAQDGCTAAPAFELVADLPGAHPASQPPTSAREKNGGAHAPGQEPVVETGADAPVLALSIAPPARDEDSAAAAAAAGSIDQDATTLGADGPETPSQGERPGDPLLAALTQPPAPARQGAAETKKDGSAPAPGAPDIEASFAPTRTDDPAPAHARAGAGKDASGPASATTGAGASQSQGDAQPAGAQAGPLFTAGDGAIAGLHGARSIGAAGPQAPRGANLGPAGAAVAQQIARRFDGGATRFDIRLDPPELGRVDVRIDVSRDKKVTATIAADNPQTLQDLVRSARELQRALTEAGLDLSDNGLSFSDRRESSAQTQFGDDAPLRGRGLAADDEAVSPVTPARPFGFERWDGARVDVWV